MAQTQQQAPEREARTGASEPLVDAFLQHQVRIQGLSADEVRKFAPFLKQIDADVRKRLSGDALTDYSKARLVKLLTAMDGTLADVFSGYRSQLTKDLNAFASHEAAFTVDTMDAHIDGVDFDLPTASQIRAAVKTRPLSVTGPDGGKLLDAFVDDWTDKERKAVVGVIRKGVVEGRTNAQMVQAIRGTRAAKYANGLLNTVSKDAQAIVHTAVQHVSSAARQDVFDRNADIVKGVRWIATLDAHTCPICRSLDQRTFKADAGPRPPIHIHDRCTMVPVLAPEWDKFLKGATRPAVRDGKATQVPASEDYYAWLKRQPKVFVEQVLGPTRAELLLNGGLSASRFSALMLDRNFKPLTLARLRELEPGAFKRAGL